MKLNGRTLKRRLYGLTMLPDRVARVRHFRGHGVHSPFVYQIVRKVFMQKRFLGEERALYDRLIALGLSHRRAMQLQNLAVHLGYHTAAFDAWSAGCDWVLLTTEMNERATRQAVEAASAAGTTVALLTPYDNPERAQLTQELIEAHRCTSVDHRGYLLLFTNPNLPKQHYRI